MGFLGSSSTSCLQCFAYCYASSNIAAVVHKVKMKAPSELITTKTEKVVVVAEKITTRGLGNPGALWHRARRNEEEENK